MGSSPTIARPLRSWSIYPGVFLTSAAILMLQVALTRLFSFTLWYHFAYVVISLALLGYGASGALLSVFPGILRGNLPRTLCLCALAAAIVIPLSLLVYAHTPFYPLQLLEQPVQWWYLAAYYAATGVPFFLAGMCIAGAIAAASQRVTRVYCADLVGAGLGAGLVVSAIWRFETPGGVILAGGLMAGAAVCWALWWKPRMVVAPVALIGILAAAGGPFWRGLEFHTSADKTMAIQLRPVPGKRGDGSVSAAQESGKPAVQSGSVERGCRLLSKYTRWGAVYRIDVLQPLDDATRSRCSYTTGASTHARGEVPDWRSIPHDGDNNAIIFAHGDPDRLQHFENHAIALPYLFLKRGAKVLALGAGGGTEVLVALRHHAKDITAIELDPLTVKLATKDLADYDGRFAERPGVHYQVGEGRSFVGRSKDKYDLIQINLVDTLTAASIGANVMNENYLYTVEATEEYLDHLNKDGIFCILHFDVPPGTGAIPFRQGPLRAGGGLVALERRGVRRAGNNIAIIYARGYMAYLIRARPFTQQEVDFLDRYCADNGFRPVHLPYRVFRNEMSRFMRASPAARAEYIARSAVRRDPPTDDSPFVWPYFKWTRFFDPAHRYERMAMANGQLVMLPLVGVAVAAALVFILGPLALFRRRGVSSPAAGGLALYFAALGFGFMFIEISFIQKFVLFLGYPTYSLTVVLSALLVSSGIGSLSSQRLIARAERSLLGALGGLLALGLLYIVGAPHIFSAFLGYALWARIAVAVALIVPLGFAMGMFFPTGIRVVNELAPQFVPWAWGINASTSVVAAILAVMLAMTVGFRMVAIVSLAIYVIGVLGLYRACRRACADSGRGGAGGHIGGRLTSTSAAESPPART
jgi:hypothetical protein